VKAQKVKEVRPGQIVRYHDNGWRLGIIERVLRSGIVLLKVPRPSADLKSTKTIRMKLDELYAWP
jgi:hypothetical protein